MLHPNKKSILCDYCGAIVALVDGEMKYHSVNFKKIEVSINKVNSVDDELDLDMCDKCYTGIFALVKEINIKNRLAK